MKLYAIKDKIAQSYFTPFASRTHEEVIRSLRDTVNQPAKDNIFYNHPKDFAAYHIGEFDSQTGVIAPSHPTLVVECSTLVIPKES